MRQNFNVINTYVSYSIKNKMTLAWWKHTKCIVCGDFIFHQRNQATKFSRIAHKSCARKRYRRKQ